jgi:hypothetical protein
MLPDGFSDLVDLVIQDWDWDNLPKTNSDIWDALLYPIFLGRSVRSAQAAYAKDIMSHMIDYASAKKIPTDPVWSKKASALIDMELGAIRGTPGEGLKKAILEYVRQEVVSLSLSRTIGGALEFFEKNGICVKKIASLKDDEKNTNELVAGIDKVFNVGIIKGVLWLYSCGIAKDLVPPNNHTITFLDDCGYPGFSWSRNPPADWIRYAPACKAMKDVAQKVSAELEKQVTPKQTQFAAWYLQTSKGLLTGHKSWLTPKLLIEYLDSRRLTIEKFNKILDNVEELEKTGMDLKSFLEST